MQNNNLNPKFADQYAAIVTTVEEHIGIQQGEIAKKHRSIGSRPTILSRLTDLMNAGVIERAWGFGPPSEVRYQVLNTAPLDALMDDSIVLDESEDEIRGRIRNEFAALSHENKWLSFRHLYNEAGNSSLDEMSNVLEIMVAEGELVEAPNDDDDLLNYYHFSFRRSDDQRWQRKDEQAVEPVQASFAGRVADFLASTDGPWQSAGTIGKTFGIDAETVNKAMDEAYDEDPSRFRANNVNPKTKKAFDLPNRDTVRCYALTERVGKPAPASVVKDAAARADQDYIIECVGSDSLTTQEIQSLTDINATALQNDLEDLVRAGRLVLHNRRYFAPVEAPPTVETPVEAPAPVEAPVAAPTPVLTLRDIIEQAVQAAVELANRENEARIAELTVERDKLRNLAETAQARLAAAESAMLTIRQVVGLGTV